MNVKLLKDTAKYLWLLMIFVFVSFYGYEKYDYFYLSIQSVSLFLVFLSLFFITLGKVFLVENMRLSAKKNNIDFSFFESFSIYNLTQMAKYIPGSIWQFIGRVAILKKRNVEAKRIRDSLLSEQIWVVGGALIIGVFLIALSAPSDFFKSVSNIYFVNPYYLSLILFLLIILVFFFRGHAFLQWGLSLLPTLRPILIVLMCWLCLGSSLWILLFSFKSVDEFWLFSIGVYSIAYVAGFLVPFAPAGIGVREAVIVFCLASFISADQAILLAALNRILYFISELVLFFSVFLIKLLKSPKYNE